MSVITVTGCAELELHKTEPFLPVHMSIERERLAPVAFSHLGINVPRGRTVGLYKYVPLTCAAMPYPEITWSQSRIVGQDVELGDAFFRVMNDAGFNVLGHPDELFEGANTKRHADFRIAAQIKDIRLNLCAQMLLGVPTGRVSGEASLVVEWQVYSSLNRRVVLKKEIASRAEVATPSRDAEQMLFVQAFEDGAARLAATREFARLVTQEEQPVRAIVTAEMAPMQITGPRLSRRPIVEHMNAILDATVTVLIGTSHGSGFVISNDGLILTNSHVTDDARKVRVRFRSGLELDADVLRRDPIRDVSLLKIGARIPPLPIRQAPLAVGEEVYAVGTPLDLSLQASVTKGIVSGFRRFKGEDPLIQADVDIHAGNSGGPLLDGRGNVVGISVSGRGKDDYSVGTNFFIPIADALSKLNLQPGTITAAGR